MKNKLQSIGSRFAAFYLLALALALNVLLIGSAKALPVTIDPAEPIAQVAETAENVLPYVMALAAAGIVFKLIRRWIR